MNRQSRRRTTGSLSIEHKSWRTFGVHAHSFLPIRACLIGRTYASRTRPLWYTYYFSQIISTAYHFFPSTQTLYHEKLLDWLEPDFVSQRRCYLLLRCCGILSAPLPRLRVRSKACPSLGQAIDMQTPKSSPMDGLYSSITGAHCGTYQSQHGQQI